jgi:hypothetical protein
MFAGQSLIFAIFMESRDKMLSQAMIEVVNERIDHYREDARACGIRCLGRCPLKRCQCARHTPSGEAPATPLIEGTKISFRQYYFLFQNYMITSERHLLVPSIRGVADASSDGVCLAKCLTFQWDGIHPPSNNG